VIRRELKTVRIVVDRWRINCHWHQSVDVANKAAEFILLQHDLGVLRANIEEGRQEHQLVGRQENLAQDNQPGQADDKYQRANGVRKQLRTLGISLSDFYRR